MSFYSLGAVHGSYFVKVDNRLPERILHLMEIPHTHFTEITRVVLVEIGAVVVLATGHTATTGVLPVLANTTMTSRDVSAAVKRN